MITLWRNGMKVLVIQLCPTLCNSMDCSSPGSSDHGILQARILEWVSIPFSGDLPDPGIEPRSPPLQVDSLRPEPPVTMKGVYQRAKIRLLSSGWLDSWQSTCRVWWLITSLVTSILFSSQTQWVTLGSMMFSEPQFIYLEKERAVQLGLWDPLWM